MFWKSRVSLMSQMYAFLKKKPVDILVHTPSPPRDVAIAGCRIHIGSVEDSAGIVKLLNDWFETGSVKTTVSMEWVRYTYLENSALWIVAKDAGGTVRGCISSFKTPPPYPNSLIKCGEANPWGLVDWFCVHPLWREKGLSSALLETLDFITHRLGRRAHIFLKEGVPLPFPNLPIYSTLLRCRKAGTHNVKQMREGTGLIVHEYNCVERATDLPMVRVEGLEDDKDLDIWEDALDTELPVCRVFISGPYKIDPRRGWKTDSVVSMYAFGWTPGQWMFKKPSQEIL